ncbi:hypothetical protein AMK59_4903 [Oryctes borbonicus]|uniref:Protein artemis n=1 Tax=Oryctes borbonicus TaxID=1629725 RepID=A0A0T6B8H2_9SCAR|nr:hypothetical protein AMK59_4903 [Oryctes borbonicus]
MSTFDGIVTEIPYIRVDRFDNYDENTKIFFLSHCHSDHTEGLRDEFFEMLKVKNLHLYTSPISIRILKNKYPKVGRELKQLTVGETSLIEAAYMDKTVHLTVNAIPAGHCPGSIMFLFETKRIKTLCTGDYRIDNQGEFTSKYFKDVGCIDTVYLDTTFCKREYPHFPSRKETLTGLCNVIQRWLDSDKKNVIKLDIPAIYGSEFLFKGIFKETGYKIHVNNNRYLLHKFIPDMDEIVDVNDHMQKLRIHVCGRTFCRNLPHDNICEIKITATVWEHYEPGSSPVQHITENFYRVCASYHPSYTEICDFIGYLKPKRIVPCVEPKDQDEKEELLQLLREMLNRRCDSKRNRQEFFIDATKMLKTNSTDKQISHFDKLLSSPPRNLRE